MKNRIVMAQTAILEDDLEKLKSLTGKSGTKDALASAVQYCIENMKTKKEEV